MAKGDLPPIVAPYTDDAVFVSPDGTSWEIFRNVVLPAP